MKQARNFILNAMILFILSLGSGCSDPNGVLDHSTTIPNRNWGYVNDIKEHVTITDNSVPYNFYFNVRVTGDYKYSNMFVLLHTTGPGMKPHVMRYELKLADVTGKWLGSGTGGVYAYQIPFKQGFRFPTKGTYNFLIEQNMRDNPLHEVSDIGLRVEKAK
ncbi:hypothetical protein GCM10028827_27450 [Mucilaginibacter myungsuensis]|uniref:Gliding motility lipoprotein GldH n=2 Tax=Mucilaginibacter myungsuensis TaxID=649104 RepID=A0A929L4V5_9SPHI|nr:gliding motility lipoprotein GldH [Mucilaginibacter myungsuensis]